MLTIIVILLFAGAVVFDFRPKLKAQPKKNKVVYFALIAVSFIVLMLYSFGLVVPSPAVPISEFIKTIFNVK